MKKKSADQFNEVYKEAEAYKHKIIIKDGKPYWEQNSVTRELVNTIGLNNIILLFAQLGITKNSEIYRKLYRDIGYSIFGYWEIFYWEANNPIAHEYRPA